MLNWPIFWHLIHVHWPLASVRLVFQPSPCLQWPLRSQLDYTVIEHYERHHSQNNLFLMVGTEKSLWADYGVLLTQYLLLTYLQAPVAISPFVILIIILRCKVVKNLFFLDNSLQPWHHNDWMKGASPGDLVSNRNILAKVERMLSLYMGCQSKSVTPKGYQCTPKLMLV